jgi:hypothetical protein
MPMEGQWRRVNTPVRRLTQRERVVAIVAAALTAVVLIVLVAFTAGDSRPAPAPGCVRAPIAHVMGGEELNACGVHAKRICAANATLEDPVSRSIQASCRQAGLP